MRRILFSLLLLAGLTGLATSSRGQSPDNTGPYPDPDSCGWIPDSSYQRVGTSDCFAWVYFCWRYCDTLQVWVWQVTPDSTIYCDSIDPIELIHNMAYKATIVGLVRHGSSAPCPGFTVVTSFIPGCWEFVSGVGAGPHRYRSCSA